tara:strand:+ start:227 stop:451 length:225 start_codon:yes stop_codon:yes gene_type:complete
LFLNDIKEIGFKKNYLATDYMRDQIEKYIFEIGNVKIITSREDNPFGIGGVIKNSDSQINSDIFLFKWRHKSKN